MNCIHGISVLKGCKECPRSLRSALAIERLYKDVCLESFAHAERQLRFHHSIDPDLRRRTRNAIITCALVALASTVGGPILWYYLLTH